MLTSTHFSTLSSPLITEGSSINFTAISSVLTLLGWQDKSAAITQATEAESALAQKLKAAYAQYTAFPDAVSTAEFKANLTAVIDKLEKDMWTGIVDKKIKMLSR